MGSSPSVWCHNLGAKWYPLEAEHFKEESNAEPYGRFPGCLAALIDFFFRAIAVGERASNASGKCNAFSARSAKRGSPNFVAIAAKSLRAPCHFSEATSENSAASSLSVANLLKSSARGLRSPKISGGKSSIRPNRSIKPEAPLGPMPH